MYFGFGCHDVVPAFLNTAVRLRGSRTVAFLKHTRPPFCLLSHGGNHDVLHPVYVTVKQFHRFHSFQLFCSLLVLFLVQFQVPQVVLSRISEYFVKVTQL
jgi:hypothetical protein